MRSERLQSFVGKGVFRNHPGRLYSTCFGREKDSHEDSDIQLPVCIACASDTLYEHSGASNYMKVKTVDVF